MSSARKGDKRRIIDETANISPTDRAVSEARSEILVGRE